MAKMIFDLDNNTEREFRETVAKVKGLHKGVIKESLEEAIQIWLKNAKKKMKEDEEEVKASK
jgi:regulator of replication initiation timing